MTDKFLVWNESELEQALFSLASWLQDS